MYINQDPIGLAGGLNLSMYVSDPLGTIDPLGLAGSDRLSIDEMETRIAANNKSGQSDSLILCMAWKESNFDPTQVSRDPNSSATGLLQMTGTAVKQVNKLKSYGSFSMTDMLDPDKNLQAGTAYLKWTIQWKKGLTAGINQYGTGPGYADNIEECKKCLDSCAKTGLTCDNDGKQKCLDRIHK
jgi:uncharacterized protein RhaS with RHS repeats